jgi:integrase
MTKVNRRERQLKGSIALYLDYYIGDQRKQEATHLHIYPGNDDRTKQLNKDNNIRFEILRNARERELLNGITALPVNRSKIDFFKYYQQYFIQHPTKERRAAAVLQKLQAYSKRTVLPVSVITEHFLHGFKHMLEASLSGETPHNYFKLLAKVLRQATKDGYFTSNPADGVAIKRQEGTPKETLTIDELKVLLATECSNDGVKRAFLFCSFTGLRYCDVSKLKWKNISNGVLSIVQSKTRKAATQELHETALQLLGKAGQPEDLVFTLPTTLNGCNKVLKYWVKKAGIGKKITWHCARHSTATNLVLNEADIVGVQMVLGHTSLRHTQKYIHNHNIICNNALQKLPKL